MQINGYTIYEHECFTQQLDRLATTIESQKRSEKSSRSEEAKLLERILGEIENIALNPDSPEYRLGKTLGPEYKFWRRAKFMGRYRLFFRYDSNSKIIILAWVNDSGTKRTYGGKNDAYTVFKKCWGTEILLQIGLHCLK
ncbi:Toxin YhaV [Neisseria gonorrhoeae]|uniref:Toxin YhaV n=1 Tax=Neisseria gonorrhoeae TaxID=485 RepID=A0A378VWK5_NEIGO|nr:Toxin YhaV [Neisseria gonorrhoeae]